MIQINVHLPGAQMEFDPLEVMTFCGLSPSVCSGGVYNKVNWNVCLIAFVSSHSLNFLVRKIWSSKFKYMVRI